MQGGRTCQSMLIIDSDHLIVLIIVQWQVVGRVQCGLVSACVWYMDIMFESDQHFLWVGFNVFQPTGNYYVHCYVRFDFELVHLFSCPSGWWFGTFFIFPYIGNNHPNWLIFVRGVQITNQFWFSGPCPCHCPCWEVANSIRVIKTKKQTSSENCSYLSAAQQIIEKDLIGGLGWHSCQNPKMTIDIWCLCSYIHILYTYIYIYMYMHLFIYAYLYMHIFTYVMFLWFMYISDVYIYIYMNLTGHHKDD